jgi:hypothetical protein
MSKARPPKRKEEYVPSDEIKEFCNKILEAGMHLLASMSSVGFSDAESVSNAIACVLSVVEQYKLVGRWVTPPCKQHREGVCDNKRDSPCEIFLHVFFINQCNAQSLTIGFSSDYSAGHHQLHGEVEQVF